MTDIIASAFYEAFHHYANLSIFFKGLDFMDIYPIPNPNSDAEPNLPIVYAHDSQAWEYKLFIRDMEADNPPDEEEINPLGAQGWELVGMFLHTGMLYFYFKRPK